MSPGAAAAAGVPGTAGVDAIAGASSVHRPEKSGGGCAGSAAKRMAVSQSAANEDRRITFQPCRDSMVETREPASVSRIRSSPQITLPWKTFWISWTICSRTLG